MIKQCICKGREKQMKKDIIKDDYIQSEGLIIMYDIRRRVSNESKS